MVKQRKLALCVALPALLMAGCTQRQTVAPAAAAMAQKHFATPRALVDALVQACRSQDAPALVALVGEQYRSLVMTGDQGADRARCERFVASADQMTRLDPAGKDTLVLAVGTDDYPFPIPLVKDEQGWRLDTEAGAQEILRREVGGDELNAIIVCRTYVQAQKQYAQTAHDGQPKGAYAQKLVSSSGKHDGLYWPDGKGPRSPFGPLVAAAGDYANGKRPPGSWHGYYFRILTAQGGGAPGGQVSYVANGRMTKGFALVAYPVEYKQTGIMTFIVDQQGVVYQKDLGPGTTATVDAMTAYAPDSTWTVVPN